MQILTGTESPLGLSYTERGINVAVACDVASRVYLCLFAQDTETPLEEHWLPGKTGNVYHGEFIGLAPGMLYAFRLATDKQLTKDARLVADPYATRFNRPFYYTERLYQENNPLFLPKGIVPSPPIDSKKNAASRPAKPNINVGERIVYEAHVKGLTHLHPEVPKQHRGTYVGASHPAVIAHLKSLGITTVQFMPIQAFMPEPFITDKGMTNYWGYNPVSFFAPEPRYAFEDALSECKSMVDTYHESGLEVIVDVVFNHTAEGGPDGPNLIVRGLLGHDVYTQHESDKGIVYANYSGCGNTLNLTHPWVFTYVMQALRYWLTEIGVDGFRFDLATCLGRDPHEFVVHSALLRAINQDPIIGKCVLIAEPWDIGVGGYQLGRFEYPWHEVNDKYRDTVRGFWRGDEGLVGEFATRLMGSRDTFSKKDRPIHASVNCLTYHDGFTLHDLVTYADKHNLANGENNQDGHNHNLSSNYGVEGETLDASIVKTREQQKRNLFACLMFSQGTPHVLGGDELSRTQLGNNNAYCQDNELNWYNWELNKRKQDFLDFCRYVIGLRQQSHVLGTLHLIDDTFSHQHNVDVVNWYKPDGTDKASVDWQQRHNRAFALEMKGNKVNSHHPINEHWLLCFNAGENDVRFHLPTNGGDSGWRLRLDTRYASLANQPDVCVYKAFLQEARSVVLFSFEQSLSNPH